MYESYCSFSHKLFAVGYLGQESIYPLYRTLMSHVPHLLDSSRFTCNLVQISGYRRNRKNLAADCVHPQGRLEALEWYVITSSFLRNSSLAD